MKKTISIILGLILGGVSIASASQITVPSAPTSGYVPVSTTTGAYQSLLGNAALGPVLLDANGNVTATVIPRLDYLSHLSSIVLQRGELAVATDTNGLYFGDGTTAGGIWANPWTATTTGLYYNGNSNVGIGTTSPYVKLAVSGGDIVEDRGSATTAFTRNFTIGGVGRNVGQIPVNINFTNYDPNGSAIDYTAARITALNDTGFDSGALEFFTTPNTTLSTTPALYLAGSNNVGIGTTSPGSILSVQGVANFTTATSTIYSSGGINLTSGCFSIAGTCIGSGSFDSSGLITNAVATWNGSKLVATGTPQLTVGNLNATSTTATSTFAASVLIGAPTTVPLSQLTLEHNSATQFDPFYGAPAGLAGGTPSDYPLFLNNTSSITGSSTGIGFAVSNSNANVGGALIFKRTNSNSRGELGLWNKQSTLLGDTLTEGLVITDNGVVGIGTTTPASGAIKLAVQGGVFTTASSTFMNGVNLTAGCYAVNGTCLSTGASSQWTTSGSNVYYTTGNVGIGTTSPYLPLSVDGSAVITGSSTASTFTATSTTGISLFNGKVLVSGNFTAGDPVFGLRYDASLGTMAISTTPNSTDLIRLGGPITASAYKFNDSNWQWIRDDAAAYGGQFNLVTLGSGTGDRRFTWMSSATNAEVMGLYIGALAASTGTQNAFSLTPTINQSSTGGYNAFLLNVTESAVGSGVKNLMNVQLGGVSQMLVNDAGNVGVATTTPDSKLDVNGSVRFEGASSIVTGSISGAIVGLGCDFADTAATGISSTTAFVTTPQSYPGDGLTWQTYALNSTTVRTKLCSDVTVTPNASIYNVKIIR